MKLVSNWVNIPEKVVNRPRQIESGGFKYTLSISPWDVPQQFRYIIEDDLITVEWQYMSESEPVKNENPVNGFQFELGKNSSRIYKIRVKLSELESSIPDMPTEQAEAITGALDRLKSVIKKIENNSNENNKNAIEKAANWWINAPNKSELLSVGA